ncbi:hypothetical protein, partial [Pseudomonas protegens]|uniref:hypothetical protein n=1 Tax=Pseudomonas protegens TaxID=380021 RepID=UPI0019D6B878
KNCPPGPTAGSMSCYPSAPQTEQGWGGWTLTAALRFWQEKGMCDPVNRSDEMQDLATNGDGVTSLCDVDVDRLVEDLVWPPTAEDFSVLLNQKT